MEVYSICAPSAQQPNMAERENVCQGICWSWNALNWLLVHLRGTQELKDEIKAQFNCFHLELVLSNMSNSSISKICALFLLCGMKKGSVFEDMRINRKNWMQKSKLPKHNIKLIIKTHLCLRRKHNASQSFPTSSCNILFLSFQSMSVFGAVFQKRAGSGPCRPGSWQTTTPNRQRWENMAFVQHNAKTFGHHADIQTAAGSEHV